MITPVHPSNESERLDSLKRMNILRTLPEDDYDNITRLASFICDVPISLVSLIDEKEQWFKSKTGTDLCATDRDVSFCAHAILTPETVTYVPDATQDVRFQENPLTTADDPVIFYAGVPLTNGEGHTVGTLCVIDNKPKQLNKGQLLALRNLASQVERLFELRKLNDDLQDTKKHLEKHNNLLKDFAGVVSHDMKMPLANLIVTSDILKKKYESILDDAGKNYLNYLKTSSLSLSRYITNILDHYESDTVSRDDVEEFEVNSMLEDIVDLLNIKYDCEVHLPESNYDLTCNRAALEQIFLNLIGNSLKYNDKDQTIIHIGVEEHASYFEFSVLDNGMGIAEDKKHQIFELFTTVGHLDRDGNKGHGIGLSTVQKLIETLGGTIEVNSKLGEYTEFVFTVAK